MPALLESQLLLPARLAGKLACPSCRSRLETTGKGLRCAKCGSDYRIVDQILDLLAPSPSQRPEEQDWSNHWAEDRQQSYSQRFFSSYRKAVFARTVRHFTSRYFAPEGVYVEAGSGTSETSMLVDKSGGRTLVALDLVLPVLARCHPVMDVRMRGDIFQLPFQDGALDGIWNVGVMEHFLHGQIDAILGEFYRVLRPGGRVILLWPAVFSVPQRMLRCLEFCINLRNRGSKFQFHPDEISQLRSVRQGREVLQRNRFAAVHVDPGFHSLMAFETLVGEKTQ